MFNAHSLKNIQRIKTSLYPLRTAEINLKSALIFFIEHNAYYDTWYSTNIISEDLWHVLPPFLSRVFFMT